MVSPLIIPECLNLRCFILSVPGYSPFSRADILTPYRGQASGRTVTEIVLQNGKQIKIIVAWKIVTIQLRTKEFYPGFHSTKFQNRTILGLSGNDLSSEESREITGRWNKIHGYNFVFVCGSLSFIFACTFVRRSWVGLKTYNKFTLHYVRAWKLMFEKAGNLKAKLQYTLPLTSCINSSRKNLYPQVSVDFIRKLSSVNVSSINNWSHFVT